MKSKIFKPHKDCKQCNGTGYVSVNGYSGGRCGCTTNGKKVR